MACSIPRRNCADRHFLFDRVVKTTERSDVRGVFDHAVSLRVCCGSRRLGFYRFRKVARLHSSKPWHGSFDGLHLLEITCSRPHEEPCANDWRSWLGGASAHHSRNIFAKNIPVCGGRCSGYEYMVTHVSMSTANLYSAARPINDFDLILTTT